MTINCHLIMYWLLICRILSGRIPLESIKKCVCFLGGNESKMRDVDQNVLEKPSGSAAGKENLLMSQYVDTTLKKAIPIAL